MKTLLPWTRRYRRHGIIFLVACLAYAPGFWWGAPHATAEDRRKSWAVDDEPPLGPLAQLHDMTTPGLAPDANLGYPMLHSYLVLAAYAPYMGYLVATGGLANPSGEYPYGFTSVVSALRTLSLIAHGLSVLLAAGIVVAAFIIGRTLWGEREGRWTAIATLLLYPLFYYSRTSNVDVPALFFVASSLAAFAGLMARGLTWRRLAVFSALAGCAVATKEPMAAAYLWVPFFLLVPDGAWRGVRDPGRLVMAFGVSATAAFIAYALGSGMVLDFERWRAHVAFAFQVTSRAASGSIAFLDSYPMTLAGHRDLLVAMVARLRDSLTLPGLGLAVTGIIVTLRSPARRSAWVIAPAATYLFVMFVSVRAVQLRYLLPVAFVLALFTGTAIARFLASSRPALRLAVVVPTVAFAANATWWAIDLTAAMLRDSRYVAGAWLTDVARPGDTLEYFGPYQKLPPLPATIASGLAVTYGGGDVEPSRDDAVVNHIREGWARRQPRFILIIPDHTSLPGEPFARTCPPAVFEDLEQGRLGYVRARLFHTPPLASILPRPDLDYGAVNPPVRVYVRSGDPAAEGGP